MFSFWPPKCGLILNGMNWLFLEQILFFKAQFHITVLTQINKSVVYFTVGRSIKFWCSKCLSRY